jgi:hypothetical protein
VVHQPHLRSNSNALQRPINKFEIECVVHLPGEVNWDVLFDIKMTMGKSM